MLATRANIRPLLSRKLLRQLYSNPICIRYLSTARLDPAIRNFAAALGKKQPCFSISPQNVCVLSAPNQFYQRLLDMVRRARRRIFISSLYIGYADKRLIDTLHEALHNNVNLEVYLHLDLNRSTRPGPSSTVHVVLPLLRDYPGRVHVSLFRSPKLRGIMGKLVPPRFNEGWGTWHAKIYGADDEVMISGANLNRSYYTNRQDRYIHFTAQPTLAQYCFSFLESMSTCSYRLLPTRSVTSAEGYRLEWPDPDTHLHNIEFKAEEALSKLQASYMQPSPTPQCDLPDKSHSEVLVFPIIQAGQFNIREEERCMTMLFDHLSMQGSSASFNPSIDLTSGYFGLYKPYQDLILRSSIDCRIIAASPMANGFYGSHGLSGRIPDGYTLLEQGFMKAVNAAGRNWSDSDKGVQLNEWTRQGWTYHAKGIWLSPSPDSAPILTLFGSTNLNSRSAHLDTELSFVMLTSSDVLRRNLHEEVQALRQWAVSWKGRERRVSWTTKVLASIVGGML